MKKQIFFTLFMIGVLSPFIVLGYYLKVFEYDISSLVNYHPATTTRIYDKNGEKIANIFDEEHRYYAPFNEIPPRAVEALLAIEDTTFFEHQGVNIDAIFRAIIKDIEAGKMVEGASTITQQLVKNKLLTRDKKISRKVKELIYSVIIEAALTKEEILERYLNEIYFGHSYYGIKTAADGYFHKELADLTLKEIAILVGLPKAPSSYAPTKNYEISMGRANRVISRMFSLGWIDEDTYKRATAENPKVYDETLTQNMAPFVVDEVMRRLAEQGIKDIKTGGYKIYTTIDLRLQKAGEESLKFAYDESVKRIEVIKNSVMESAKKRKVTPTLSNDLNTSLLNGALVSIDPKNGDVLALVGSVDYKVSSFNRATQGKRQPGSAFKPFIYQVALDLGYSGATELTDVAKTYTYQKDGEEQKWQPSNYEDSYKGILSLREALVHSSNLATINLVNEIGLDTILKDLKKFGIQNVPQDMSISLGTISLSPLELARFYSSFANSGVQSDVNLISSIEQNSKILFTKEEHTRTITSPAQAYLMTTILKDVVERGTATKAKVNGIDIAGKTGTTNNNVDGWFCGYSPSIETVIWFGNDDNTPMQRFETGGRIAGPAFARFYENVLKLYPQVPRVFEVPEGVVTVDIDGKKEYFTDTSKPPRTEATPNSEQQLVF
ncbi:MAG: PBP1A family penicillin-binding protein [Campylobacterales bacterium]|nr:PBP1A family penicillin-binding protein [Campylobacterales bacterium]